ncbi:helix-turn-helix transcriptional regulator [Phenylobacterium sp.]|jgi:transcriptional regulator with XRE-family HTH domain|uniref:helix-turn-helix domain-containing protein n=1 Tax=Phenylobacterium sp. TaxID=1871053 RepID=UPI002E33AF8A|nr:helix-turn-helix transcriptional regulator [Phenylobacterium sp.]HEX3365710.1 helix-turn-helix transcriptional regulator [Phenylobacterium sp.]
MPKTVFTGAHSHVVAVLLEARRSSGLKQADVAARLGKHQSFISLIENSQRRVDVLEFFALADAMGANALELLAEISRRLPNKIEI